MLVQDKSGMSDRLPDENAENDCAASAASSMLNIYFQGSGMSLQDYFKFPEMKQIRNPVHEYFRLRGSEAGSALTEDWIKEGALALEEAEDGWLLLGAEHQELARIAVGKCGNHHYYARAWDGSYIGPLLRTTSAVLRASARVAVGAASVTGSVLCGAASLVYVCPPPVPPADAPPADRFVEESVEVDGDTWFFRVWLPPDLDAVREKHGGVPAFLLLHGFKECGWDNWWQTNSGLALHLQNDTWWAQWFPGILVIPQLPRRPWEERWWQHWRAPAMQRMALACLERAVTKYRADRQRLYLLGESLGTEGAWFLASQQPRLFAAVGGSCGSVAPYDWIDWTWDEAPLGVYRKLADGIGRDIPLWFCHGKKDDFVPIEQSRLFYEALQQNRASSTLGGILRRAEAAEVVFREYEDLDHHVWDHAYGEDRMIEWLLKHRRP